jgi:hypothetical protein
MQTIMPAMTLLCLFVGKDYDTIVNLIFGGLIHRRGDSSHESGLLFIRGAAP